MIEFQEGYFTFHTYIITNKAKTVLYTGMTNNLKRRLTEHNDHVNLKSFSARYNAHYLLYFEKFTWVELAIGREKEIKGWTRIKKIELIKTINPEMRFLNHLFE